MRADLSGQSALSTLRKIVIIVVIIVVLFVSAGVALTLSVRSSTTTSTNTTRTISSNQETSSSAIIPSQSTSLSSLSVGSSSESSLSSSGSSRNSSADFTLDLSRGTLLTGNDILNGLQNVLGNPTISDMVYDPLNDQTYGVDTDQQLVVLNSTGGIVSISDLPSFSVAANANASIYTGKYMVVDSSNGNLYATSFANYANEENEYAPTNVTVISTSSDSIIANIVIGGNTSTTGSALGIAYDNSTNQIFVAMENAALSSAYVAVIDASTNTLTGKIAVGDAVSGVAYDPSDGYLYVSSHFTDAIIGINPSTQQIVSNMSFSFCTLFCTQSVGPGSLYYNQGSIYATASPYAPIANVSAIDPATSSVTANFSIPSGYVESLAFGSDDIYAMGSVSISNATSGATGSGTTVFQISTSNYSSTGSVYIDAGVNPAMALDPRDSVLYVGDGLYSSVDLVNSTMLTLTGSIPVAFEPGPISLDESNGNIYVGNELANDLAVVNGSTNKVEGYITVPSVPSQVTWDPVNSELYVLTNWQNTLLDSYSAMGANGTNDLTVINGSSNSIMGMVPVGNNPMNFAIDYYDDQIAVSDYGALNSTTGNLSGAAVTFVNGTSNTVSSVVNLPASPDGVSFDPYVGDVFAQYWNNSTNEIVVEVLNDTSGSVIAAVSLNGVAGSDPPLDYHISPQQSDSSEAMQSGESFPQYLLDELESESNCYQILQELKDEIGNSGNEMAAALALPFRASLSGECPESDLQEVFGYFSQLLGGVAGGYYSDLGSSLAGGDIFVANPSTDSIADINDTSNVFRSNITLSTSPFVGFYVNPTNSLYFLDLGGSPSVTVINPDTDKVTATSNVGNDPIAVQYDNSTKQLFVVDMGDLDVAVVNPVTNQVTGYIDVGMLPGNELYDPLNGDLYVCNLGSGTLSIILMKN